MLRTPLDKSYIKRTIQPLYAATQATPKAGFLDPNWDRSVDIYPGMCLMRAGGDLVTLVNGTGDPYALSAFYAAPVLGIDEIKTQGINACAYWVLDPDAEFQIESPAFDATLTWTDPTDGTTTLVHAYGSGAKRGQLCPAGTALATAKPIAKLLKVVSTNKIIVGGLSATDPVDAV